MAVGFYAIVTVDEMSSTTQIFDLRNQNKNVLSTYLLLNYLCILFLLSLKSDNLV